MALLGGQPVPEPLEETADKPASQLEVSAGENVMLRRTGRILGTVRDVLFDGTELVGIVMKPRGFLTEDVVLQAGFLQRSDDAALFADLGEDDLEHLTPFKPAD